jgi:hypothetical protein
MLYIIFITLLLQVFILNIIARLDEMYVLHVVMFFM